MGQKDLVHRFGGRIFTCRTTDAGGVPCEFCRSDVSARLTCARPLAVLREIQEAAVATVDPTDPTNRCNW